MSDIKKIDKDVNVTRNSYKRLIKNDRKEATGSVKDNFLNTTVYITWEQGNKLDEFIQYCKMFLCANCMKKTAVDNFHSNENDELVLLCDKCGAQTYDGYTESKNYVRWFNDILENYGMSFKNGFPKLIVTKNKKHKDGTQEARSWAAEKPAIG